MKGLKVYDIEFAGLKNGKHHFDYTIQDDFFALFDFEQEFDAAHLKVYLEMNKKETMIELSFTIQGKVQVICDVSNEPFELPIESHRNLVLKFGEEFLDEGEDLIIIPYQEYKVNIAQWIYEFVVLAIPVKKIHPAIEDGTMIVDIPDHISVLYQEEKQEEIDPRWDLLKKLK